MKLGSSALGIGFWGGLLERKGKVLEYSGDWCNLRFNMDCNTHGWTTFILIPRVGAMGMRKQRIKGAYMNSKCRVRGKYQCGLITLWRNNGWGVMKN